MVAVTGQRATDLSGRCVAVICGTIAYVMQHATSPPQLTHRNTAGSGHTAATPFESHHTSRVCGVCSTSIMSTPPIIKKRTRPATRVRDQSPENNAEDNKGQEQGSEEDTEKLS
jgi:hypothetical protein